MQAEPGSLTDVGRRSMFAAACVGVVGLTWTFPVERLPLAAGLQSLLGGASVLMLAGVVWLAPGMLRSARLAYPEWALALFIIVGSITTVLAPAPLGRLAQPVWWLQAFLVVVIVARMADRRLLMKCLHWYGALAVSACAVLIVYRLSGSSGKAPFMIYQNHFAFLLILPVTFYLHRLVDHEQHGRPGADALALLFLIPGLLLTQSRAVWIGLAVAATVLLIVVLTRWLARRSKQHVLLALMLPVRWACTT